jgi:hypothetical protein
LLAAFAVVIRRPGPLVPGAAGLVGLVIACGAVGLTGASPRDNAPAPAPSEAIAAKPVDTSGDPLPPGAVARLGTRRLCGPWDPDGATFSPDGTKLATWNYFGLTAWDAATGRQLVERRDYYTVVWNAAGWRADGVGVAVVLLPDRSYFVSAFTDPAEVRPNPPPDRGPTRRRDRDVALSPDATRVALVRTPDEPQFTIELYPATPGRSLADLKPERTLGPFPGPCRDVRYTPGGLVTLHGNWDKSGEPADDWSLAVIDPDRNAVVRMARIPPPAGVQQSRVHAERVGGRPVRRGRPAPRAATPPPRRDDPVLGPGRRQGTAAGVVPPGPPRDRARLHPGR